MVNMIENKQSKIKGEERWGNKFGLNGSKIKAFNNHQNA